MAVSCNLTTWFDHYFAHPKADKAFLKTTAARTVDGSLQDRIALYRKPEGAAGGGAMGGIGSECGVGEIIGECGILKEWLGDKQPVP